MTAWPPGDPGLSAPGARDHDRADASPRPGAEPEPKIAISYRRVDSTAIVGRMGDRLADRYGREAIFVDVNSIPFGTDFRRYIQTVWSRLKVLLVVVGPQWLGEREGSAARIQEPDDLVRIEVETALKGGIAVIPVLIDGARMPAAGALPESLRAFAALNAAPVDGGRDFHHHMDQLVEAIDRIAGIPPRPAPAATGRELADGTAAGRLGPARLAAEIALPVFVLVVLHHLIVNALDLATIYLRIASLLVPFPFGALLFWRARLAPAASLAVAAGVGLLAVALMTVSQALNSATPILPSGAVEWRESIEYVVSIAASFFAGCLAAPYALRRRGK